MSEVSMLTAKIREASRRLGFFKMGIARAGPLPLSTSFDAWLEQGMHGEMDYMQRQALKRKDPGLVLRHARTLLVLSMNYYSGDSLSDDPMRGKISRYARGEDYHQLVGARMKLLQDLIEREVPGVRILCYADTGPVMEKVWGAETSLGWMGKHSILITRDHGSWFFIGVMLLDVELEYDSKEEDHCGTCTRCLPACPTGAIVAPCVVDARRCISYLTIELRTAIPRGLRPLIGNRIYGCDDCQEVCPWNRLAVKTVEKEQWLREEYLVPELVPLVGMSTEQFNCRFRKSPIRRVKRDGFVRNVAVALGNSRRPEAVAALGRALCDRSALVRAHAAWALGRIATIEARKVLEQARRSETDPEVMEEIVSACGDLNASDPIR